MSVKEFFAVIVAAAVLNGCGAVESLNYTTTNDPRNNDAGPTTVVKLASGVVVSSVPIANRIVNFEGANGGTVSGGTDGNGNYITDIAALTPPLIVSVVSEETGKPVANYSFAREQGVVNINPLTNLVVLVATGEADPYAYLSGSGTGKASRIDAGLNAAWTTVFTTLQPLISVFVSAPFNPITSNYTSVTGLHNFFGLVGFSVNNGILTLTNLNKGTVIGSAPVAAIATMTLNTNEFPSGSVAPLNGPIITSATAVQGGALEIVGTGFMPSGLDVIKLVDHSGTSFDLTNFWYPNWIPSGAGNEIKAVLPANVARDGATLTVTSTNGGKTLVSSGFTVTVRPIIAQRGPVVSSATGSRGDTITLRGSGFTKEGTDSVRVTDSSGSSRTLTAWRQGWSPSGTGTEIQLDLPLEVKSGPALITVTSNAEDSPPFYLTIR